MTASSPWTSTNSSRTLCAPRLTRIRIQSWLRNRACRKTSRTAPAGAQRCQRWAVIPPRHPVAPGVPPGAEYLGSSAAAASGPTTLRTRRIGRTACAQTGRKQWFPSGRSRRPRRATRRFLRRGRLSPRGASSERRVRQHDVPSQERLQLLSEGVRGNRVRRHQKQGLMLQQHRPQLLRLDITAPATAATSPRIAPRTLFLCPRLVNLILAGVTRSRRFDGLAPCADGLAQRPPECHSGASCAFIPTTMRSGRCV
mmetsp:Transcript_106527/g.306302  ORF Transcript_106527/g.306302 Transcript_106527/m.306302 type:complete len:255 (+) Transcript_106527:1089-1853(+)